ncbi:hypothetical protein J6590_000823 [Homalodisca vitripennis]|nr:hypothetical protein J6590_000823 [Homalodisca vitripennis]
MLTHCVVYYWVEPESRQTLRIFIMDCLAIIFLLVLTVEVAFGNSRFYHGPTAIPHVLHDGHIADTREVAAAKSAHLAALATQSHSHGYGASYGYSGDVENSGSHGDLRYHGPTAIPHVLHDGHIADTHSSSQSAHLAALATQSHSHGYGASYGYSDDEHSSSHGDLRYHGPTAIPHVLHDGHIADTQIARKAQQTTPPPYHTSSMTDTSQTHMSGDVENSGSHGDLRYHGPTAIPHVLHDGHIADTHEVAAAKAKAHSGYGLDYSGIYGEHSGEHHGYSHSVVPYHGPLAKPKVLKSGYLADTHEVAAAKKRHIHLGTNKDNYRGYSN